MKRGINQVNTQLSGFSKAVKGVGVALAASFGASEVTNFLKNAVTQFASLNEAISKTEVVFKENGKEALAWAKDNQDALLSTEQAALSYLSTLGSILNQSGLTADESFEFSKTLTQLVADLSSFAEVPVEQAFTAVKGAIVGEREALKTLGFVITEAEVKTEALTLGLVKQGEALTTNAKAQANISLLMKKTAEAQGDVARTGDSLANQLKKVGNEVEELATYFGKGLINGLEGSEETGQQLIQTLQKLQPLFEDLGEAVSASADGLQDLVALTDSVTTTLDRFTGGLLAAEGGLIGFGTKVINNVFALEQFWSAVRAATAANNAFNRSLPQRQLDDFSVSSLYTEENLRKTADTTAYFGSELGYSQEKMTEWTLEQRKIQEENNKLTESFGSGARAVNDEAKALEEASRILEEEFQRVLEETNRAIDEWRQKITSKLNIGTAFQEANNATKAAEAAQRRLAELRATPADKRGDDYAQREAELVAEAERLGAEAGKGFLTRLAEQATDAETLSRNLANLDAAGLNEVLISQIASDSNGAALSQAIVDGITNDGYGVLDQLNRQATRIQNAGQALGETLVEPLPVEGAKGGEDFLFGLKGKGKEGNGLLPQIKADAPKVKKAIKNSLRTSVEVKVVYTPDTSRLEGAPGGRSVVRSVQEFERLNGRKWRDRVR